MIALFTVVLAVVTYVQWSVMRDQNEIMRQQMRIEQRAWLGSSGPPLSRLFPNRKTDYVEVPVKNSGATPGRIQLAHMEVFRKPKGTNITPIAQKVFDLARKQPQQLVVAPDGTNRLIPTAATYLDDAAVASIESGDWILWAIGRITYVDIYEIRHFTEFCFFFDPGSREDLNDGQFVGYHLHNDMGDEPENAFGPSMR